MTANQTLETTIGIVRNSLEHMAEDLPELKVDRRALEEKIDRNHETSCKAQTALRDKLDDTRSELLDRTEQVRSELTGKIEQVRSDLRAELTSLRTETTAELKTVHQEIGAINVAVAKLGGQIKSLRRFAGAVLTAAALVEVGYRLGTYFHWF